MKSWFTSDTHFGHTNVLKHSQRPFETIREMNTQLIYNWNLCVDPADNVYHLGDFAWKDAAEFYGALNGRIHKIKGNHHGAAKKIRGKFVWWEDVKELKVIYDSGKISPCTCGYTAEEGHHHQCQLGKAVMARQDIFLSHYAHRVWPRMHHGVWHLYGHSHGNLADAGDLSMDVGVDAVARLLASGSNLRPEDYRPLEFEEIQLLMQARSFVARDHHTGPEVGA